MSSETIIGFALQILSGGCTSPKDLYGFLIHMILLGF